MQQEVHSAGAVVLSLSKGRFSAQALQLEEAYQLQRADQCMLLHESAYQLRCFGRVGLSHCFLHALQGVKDRKWPDGVSSSWHLHRL